jgi:hypothetical protein
MHVLAQRASHDAREDSIAIARHGPLDEQGNPLMKINVPILPEGRAVSGEVFADVPFAAVREDIVKAFKLEDAEGWSIAIVPSNLGVTPEAYTMSPGDTI